MRQTKIIAMRQYITNCGPAILCLRFTTDVRQVDLKRNFPTITNCRINSKLCCIHFQLRKTENTNVLLMNERPLTIRCRPFPSKQVSQYCSRVRITWFYFSSLISVFFAVSGTRKIQTTVKSLDNASTLR